MQALATVKTIYRWQPSNSKNNTDGNLATVKTIQVPKIPGAPKCQQMHHNGDICTTRGNNLKTSFSYMGQNVKKM